MSSCQKKLADSTGYAEYLRDAPDFASNVVGMITDYCWQEAAFPAQAAVFLLSNKQYLVVFVGAASAWEKQNEYIECQTRSHVRAVLDHDDTPELQQLCRLCTAKKWQPTVLINEDKTTLRQYVVKVDVKMNNRCCVYLTKAPETVSETFPSLEAARSFERKLHEAFRRGSVIAWVLSNFKMLSGIDDLDVHSVKYAGLWENTSIRL